MDYAGCLPSNAGLGWIGDAVSSLWVAILHISDRTAQKIIQSHHIWPDDVRGAIVCQSGLRYVWHADPQRGRRALVEILLHGRKVLVVLYPAIDPLGHAWHLGSAYHVD